MEPTKPGDAASVRDTLALAAQYREAAVKLGEASPKPTHLPVRLLALHSIELFLNTLLLAKGLDHKAVRGLQHDFGERSRIAMGSGLVLRKRTAAHLATLSSNREYQVIRCAPALTPSLSQVNRVMAILDEVSKGAKDLGLDVVISSALRVAVDDACFVCPGCMIRGHR
ncbi:hypothetical protein [Sinorhizobium medicae]|uniref:hypothetical protein n=1 Tax=Sinorhizobium medicae TaxID=110321 RepID=UPI001911DA96|nr:hypothetical protein [Sinorhizobium medicae]